MIIERVASITDKLTSLEKATLAAELINDMEDPNEENLKKFFAELNDSEHDELVSRANEEVDR